MVVTTGKMRYRHCSGKYRSPMIENFDSVYKTSINTDGDFTMRRLAAMLCLTFCWMTLGAPLAVGGEHMTMEQLRAKYGDRKAKIALIGGVEVSTKTRARARPS